MEEAERIKWIALSYKNLKKTSHAETDEFCFYRYENLERERDFCVDIDEFEEVPPFVPMEAADASPTVWYPRCPSFTTESAPLYNSIWKHLNLNTKMRETIGILLNSADLDVIATIVHNLRLYIEEAEGNYNIITEMNLLKDLLNVLIEKNDVKVRFMTTTLIECLLPIQTMLEQLFLLHAIEALWLVFTQESDVILLTHVARCIRYFADYESDLEYLVQQGACTRIYENLGMPSTLLKSHLYDILIKLSHNNDGNSTVLANMRIETFEEIMKDIRSFENPYCKALRFLDILLKLVNNTQLESAFLDHKGPDLMLEIVENERLTECHKYAFNIIGKFYSEPYTDVTFDPRYILKRLFGYINGKLKSGNFEAFLNACSSLAKSRPNYQMRMMKLGLMEVASKVIRMDQSDDLLAAAIDCATVLIESHEGLNTFFYYNMLDPVCDILISKNRSKRVQASAALCLAQIAGSSYNRRRELLQHVEEKFGIILDPTTPAVVLREFLECFTNCTLDEYNGLKPESLHLLTKKLVELIQGNVLPSPEMILLAVRAINSVLFNSGLMIQATEEVSHYLVIGLLSYLMSPDSSIQLVDAVLETFIHLFNKDHEYVTRCLHTNLLEWLLQHAELRDKLTYANSALYTLIKSDPTIKFALVGELSYMDQIPDGFLVPVKWHHDPESVYQANMIRALPMGPENPHYFINRFGFNDDKDIQRLTDPKYLETNIIHVKDEHTDTASMGEEVKGNGPNTEESKATIYSSDGSSSYPRSLDDYVEVTDSKLTRFFSYFKIVCPEKLAGNVENARRMLTTPDHALNTIVNMVLRSLARADFTKEEKLTIIANEVDKALGRKKHPGCTTCMVDLTKALMELTGINLIPLGLAHVGYKLERSILFKLICDALDIPCRLVRTKMNNAWTEVMVNKGRKYVVDLVDQVGRLLPVESPEAAIYCRETGDKCSVHDDGSKLTIGKAYLPEFIKGPEFQLNLEECDSQLKIHGGLTKWDLLIPNQPRHISSIGDDTTLTAGGPQSEGSKTTTVDLADERVSTVQPSDDEEDETTVSLNEELAKPTINRLLTKMDSIFFKRESGGTLPVTVSGSLNNSGVDLNSMVNMKYY